MFKFTKSFLVERTSHPILVSLFLIAAVFTAAGFAVEETVGNGGASAFLVVYAIMAVFLSLTGYVMIALGKVVTRFRRQVGLPF